MEVSRIKVDFAMVQSIIDLMLNETKQLKDAVAAHSVTLGQFNKYVSQDKEARVALMNAWEFQSHVLVDEARHIADTNKDAATARNQIDIRKWMAERRARRAYGQQIDVSITQTIDISGTLAEARARILQPVRDQLAHAEPETLDVPSRIVQRVGNGGLSARDQEPPEAEAETVQAKRPPKDGSGGAEVLVPDIFS